MPFCRDAGGDTDVMGTVVDGTERRAQEDTQKPFTPPRIFAGTCILISCLPSKSCVFVWLPLFVKLLLFPISTAPFQELPCSYICSGLLLVVNANCKQELT